MNVHLSHIPLSNTKFREVKAWFSLVCQTLLVCHGLLVSRLGPNKSYHKELLLVYIRHINPFTPKSVQSQKSRKTQISIWKILKNKQYQVKVLSKMVQLNGHTIGFRLQTQKLNLHKKFPYLTVGAKGVKQSKKNLSVEKQRSQALALLLPSP